MPSALDPNPNLIDPYALAVKRQQAQQDALTAAQAQRTASEAAATDRATQEAQQKQLGDTMKVDALQWSGDTAHPQYHVAWADLPPEAKQHFIDPYGSAAANAPETYNAAFVQNGGTIPGLEHLVPNRATTKPNGEVTYESQVPVTKPPISQVQMDAAARLGIPVKPEMTPEDLQTLMAQKSEDRQTAAATQKETQASQQAQNHNDNVINQTKRIVNTNPQFRQYQGAQANFDSISKNVSKPNRTGADDAFLAQAAATMEAPGRSPTAHDIAVFMQTRGIQGNLDVLAGKVQSMLDSNNRNKAGRIFDDQTVQNLAAAAKNSIETRRESLREFMVPQINRMEDIGEDPYRHFPKSLVDDVYGVTGEKPQPGNGTAPPAPKPGEVLDGYRFKGGAPHDKNNWEKVQ